MRLQINAALPPDICACGGSVCHRLQEKPIHLRLIAQVKRIVLNAFYANLRELTKL
jgi:hypothetical protein